MSSPMPRMVLQAVRPASARTAARRSRIVFMLRINLPAAAGVVQSRRCTAGRTGTSGGGCFGGAGGDGRFAFELDVILHDEDGLIADRIDERLFFVGGGWVGFVAVLEG